MTEEAVGTSGDPDVEGTDSFLGGASGDETLGNYYRLEVRPRISGLSTFFYSRTFLVVTSIPYSETLRTSHCYRSCLIGSTGDCGAGHGVNHHTQRRVVRRSSSGSYPNSMSLRVCPRTSYRSWYHTVREDGEVGRSSFSR